MQKRKSRTRRMSYTIRSYQTADWEAVCRVIQQTIQKFFHEDQSRRTTKNLVAFFDASNVQLKGYWSTKPMIVFVAVQKKKIVGVIRGNPGRRIFQLYISGQYQGQGIGRALVERFGTAAKRRGFASVKVNATESAVPFYARVGFKKTTGVRVDSEDGVKYQPMKKILQ